MRQHTSYFSSQNITVLPRILYSVTTNGTGNTWLQKLNWVRCYRIQGDLQASMAKERSSAETKIAHPRNWTEPQPDPGPTLYQLSQWGWAIPVHIVFAVTTHDKRRKFGLVWDTNSQPSIHNRFAEDLFRGSQTKLWFTNEMRFKQCGVAVFGVGNRWVWTQSMQHVQSAWS